MERYEIAIVGTGPAGLEAAITAKIRNKKIILIGSKDSSVKVEKAHEIQNYLGLPKISGENLKKAYLDHLASMDIEITEDRVVSIYSYGDYFALQTKEGMVEADAVILATGVMAGKMYPGEEALLGRGVSYCATCDAPLYKGKVTAVIASSPKEEDEANFLAEYADKVIYFPLYEGDVHTNEAVEVIHEKPTEILGEMKATTLKTNANEYASDGVFILREAVSPGQLVPGLETEGPHVKVNLDMSTNIKGCFACGDIAGTPYQYIKSAGQGNVAALSAVNYLAEKQRNQTK